MLDESSDSRHFIMAKNKGFCPAFHKSWRHHGHRLWSTGPTVFLSSADIHLKTWSLSVSIMLGIACMETRKMTLRNLVDKLLVKMQWVFIFNFCFLYATHWPISLEIPCDISDSGVWRTKKKMLQFMDPYFIKPTINLQSCWNISFAMTDLIFTSFF